MIIRPDLERNKTDEVSSEFWAGGKIRAGSTFDSLDWVTAWGRDAKQMREKTRASSGSMGGKISNLESLSTILHKACPPYL